MRINSTMAEQPSYSVLLAGIGADGHRASTWSWCVAHGRARRALSAAFCPATGTARSPWSPLVPRRREHQRRDRLRAGAARQYHRPRPRHRFVTWRCGEARPRDRGAPSNVPEYWAGFGAISGPEPTQASPQPMAERGEPDVITRDNGSTC